MITVNVYQMHVELRGGRSGQGGEVATLSIISNRGTVYEVTVENLHGYDWLTLHRCHN